MKNARNLKQPLGTCRSRLENNIKIYLNESGLWGVDWTQLLQERIGELLNQLSEINFSLELTSNLHIKCLCIGCHFSLLGRLAAQTGVFYGHPLFIQADPGVIP
jgi:hypothetical protein